MLAIVWIFFFGSLLIILAIHTISHLWKLYRTRDSYHLKQIALIWCVPFLFFGSLFFVSWYLSPVQISKGSIVGCYEVDDRFYSGPNAQWQKKHFRFEVTSKNTFVLYERLADQTDKPFVGQVNWANQRPERWSVTMKTPHHVVDRHPTLYRQQSGFYYVFRTKKFGNMFFKRIGSKCVVKLATENSNF